MAGFSLPPIYQELLLVTSGVSIAIDEIAQSGAAVFNPSF